MSAIYITTENNSAYKSLLDFVKTFYKATIAQDKETEVRSIYELSAKEEHDAMMQGVADHNKRHRKNTSLRKHF